MPSGVKAVMMIILRNRAGHQSVTHEITVQQPGHRGDIPDHPCPAAVFASGCAFLFRVVCQIIAQFVFAAEKSLQFAGAGGERGYHAHAGKLHQSCAAAEYHSRRSHILEKIEFLIIRPFMGIAAKPDENYAVFDFRLHEQG